MKKYYSILELENGADLASVKRAYRRLAFALHPDLNPDLPDAGKKFQRLNEAYVVLSQVLSSAASSTKSPPPPGSDKTGFKTKEEAHKAYAKAKAEEKEHKPGANQETVTKEDVVKDLLNDPFARRVFEDIYSHIKNKSDEEPDTPPPHRQKTRAEHAARLRAHERAARQQPPSRSSNPAEPQKNGKVLSKLSGWLRKQIDYEQVISLPAELLVPGARVRLEIRHGLIGKNQTIELVLPSTFKPGKSVRLKGMGKRIGGWQGDLYVKLVPKTAAVEK